MKIENLETIEAQEGFLQGNQAVAFSVLGNKAERYHFIRKTLVKFDYMALPKKDKGIVIRYLIKKYTETGKINWAPYRSNGFTKKYTDNDIVLLAKTDELHDTPCGHAVKKLCERAHDVFDDKAYRRTDRNICVSPV